MPLPFPADGQVMVYIVDPWGIDAGAAAGMLNGAEQELAGRFRFEKDALRWRACRAALRKILGETLGCDAGGLELLTEEFGKPVLAVPHAGLRFNLSHCDDLALVALCGSGPVGVDIEPAGRAASLLGCERTFCHPDELAALPDAEGPRAAALLDLWTTKEALLKALGTGLSLAPETVAMATGKLPVAGLREFRVERLVHPLLTRHLARVAVPLEARGVDVSVFQW